MAAQQTEVTEDIECNECGVKFSLIFDKDEVDCAPEYCPFCNEPVKDVYSDIEEKDEDEEPDWDD